MAIFELTSNAIKPVEESRFSTLNLRERDDLQRLLRDNISMIETGLLVISEEFGEWDDARRRIDLLAIDQDANLVVIEIKRTDDGGHMELQAIRYAAMISTMTFDKAVGHYRVFLQQAGDSETDARENILSFLDWEEPDEDRFAQDVRIILVSADFSKEVTTAAMWLRDHDINIQCVRLKPYSLDGRNLIDVQQIIPLPEAADYQVQVREKVRKEREARTGGPDFTRYDVDLCGEHHRALWKRNAIFLVCQRLCRRKVAPEALATLLEKRLWFVVDGELATDEFLTAAGPDFRVKRWFVRTTNCFA